MFTLPSFARPFVSRALRGGGRRRMLVLGLVLGFLSIVIGTWLTLGSGSFEQNFRVSLGLERSDWERERSQYMIVSHDAREYQQLTRARAKIASEGYRVIEDWNRPAPEMRIHSAMNDAHMLLDQASRSRPRHAADRRLQEDAADLLGRAPLPEVWIDPQAVDYYGFTFANVDEVARLAVVLDRGGIPAVEYYRSPLGIRDAIRMLGFVAGGLSSILFLLGAPVLVGVQQAQERHENTLQPLTGTAMGPRELVLGLAAGPLSMVVLLAIPQILLFGACALVVGSWLFALAYLVALLATSAVLVVAGQLAGHIAGAKRTPGVVGISLLAGFSLLWLIGCVLVVEPAEEVIGLCALFPTAASLHLLGQTFHPFVGRFAVEGTTAALAQIAGASVLAWIGVEALSKRVEGRFGETLGKWHARLAAIVCIALALVAAPHPFEEWRPSEGDTVFYYLSLAALALPFGVLVMARVPIGEVPAKLRRLPLLRILGELGMWFAVHLALVVALAYDVCSSGLFHPVALAYLVWCFLALGLLAVRSVALPVGIAQSLWISFCAVAGMVGYFHAAMWSGGEGNGVDDVLALSHLSPVLGFLQAVCLVLVPLVLFRTLVREHKSIA